MANLMPSYKPLSRAPSAPSMPRFGSRPKLAGTVPPPVPPKSTAPPPPPKPAPAVPPVVAAKRSKSSKDEDWKEPPPVIHDQGSGASFEVVALLGQGGFARVYEVTDNTGQRLAMKVIGKHKLRDVKSKTRLYAEIKIHRALRHANVCKFIDCFEDNENVYIALELCRNGSLVDLVKKRVRLTEPETRYYLVQIAGALNYLHTHQIIHRDLKLGNVFLDERMDLKVGDFGLAALLEKEGERKTTVCGTPNYIAPEVLFAKATGHSYEVDIWSMGVIMYTMLVGKPPFQTTKVEEIYKRIRDNKYEFPIQTDITANAKDLIQKLLAQRPEERPTPADLLSHQFFQNSFIPKSISTGCLFGPPHWSEEEKRDGPKNLVTLRKRAGIDDVGGIRVRKEGILAGGTNGAAGARGTGAKAWEDGEREFNNAMAVGSPISALLRSAKQPLLVTGEGGGENLMRKLSAVQSTQSQSRAQDAARSPSAKSTITAAGSVRSRTTRQPLASVQEEDYAYKPKSRPAVASKDSSRDTENIPPGSALPLQRGKSIGTKMSGLTRAPSAASLQQMSKLPPDAVGGKTSAFELTAQTLIAAFDAKAEGKVFRDPALDTELPPQVPFVQSWVDYCHKYGMGYALTDGTVGVYFNDSTSLVLAPNDENFDHVALQTSAHKYFRTHRRLSEFPTRPSPGLLKTASAPAISEEQASIESKVNLLRAFREYIFKELYRKQNYTYVDLKRTKALDFVQKWLRANNVTMFKLSNEALQFNYSDHTKVILADNGLVVTFVDKNYHLTRHSLSQLMASAVAPAESKSPEEIRMNDKLLKRLRYCREVLITMQRKNMGKEVGNLRLGPDGPKAAVVELR